MEAPRQRWRTSHMALFKFWRAGPNLVTEFRRQILAWTGSCKNVFMYNPTALLTMYIRASPRYQKLKHPWKRLEMVTNSIKDSNQMTDTGLVNTVVQCSSYLDLSLDPTCPRWHSRKRNDWRWFDIWWIGLTRTTVVGECKLIMYHWIITRG